MVGDKMFIIDSNIVFYLISDKKVVKVGKKNISLERLKVLLEKAKDNIAITNISILEIIFHFNNDFISLNKAFDVLRKNRIKIINYPNYNFPKFRNYRLIREYIRDEKGVDSMSSWIYAKAEMEASFIAIYYLLLNTAYFCLNIDNEQKLEESLFKTNIKKFLTEITLSCKNKLRTLIVTAYLQGDKEAFSKCRRLIKNELKNTLGLIVNCFINDESAKERELCLLQKCVTNSSKNPLQLLSNKYNRLNLEKKKDLLARIANIVGLVENFDQLLSEYFLYIFKKMLDTNYIPTKNDILDGAITTMITNGAVLVTGDETINNFILSQSDERFSENKTFINNIN